MNESDAIQPRAMESMTQRSFLGMLLGFGTAVVGAALSEACLENADRLA
jgi:hypothetical protein